MPLQVGPGSIKPTPGLEGVKITVGSKEYTEQVILGYILEYTLAAAGADVRDLTGIVGSRSTREAQLSGQVDVAYEFTGNAWINYLGHEKPIPDTREQFEAVRDEDLERNGMVWLDPGPMDDTYALAASTADRRADRRAHAVGVRRAGEAQPGRREDLCRHRVPRPPGRLPGHGRRLRIRSGPRADADPAGRHHLSGHRRRHAVRLR